MGIRFRNSMILAASGTFVASVLAVLPIAGQAPGGAAAPAYRAPRSPHGDGTPNLNGIWQAMTTANFDIQAHGASQGHVPSLGAIVSIPPGHGIVVGNEIPYQPWALEKKKENAANWVKMDPEVKCFLPGIPRATYMPYPFEIIQSPTVILIAYSYQTATRRLLLGDSEEAKVEAPFDSWMGWSRARWEGDTLVVDVTGFDERTWFDRAGNFHSDALHVVERYTPVSPDHLSYEATIEDSKVFTRPWQMRLTLYRQREVDQLLEYKCAEFAEEYLWGHLRKQTGN